jgi:general secretion pathway protein K
MRKTNPRRDSGVVLALVLLLALLLSVSMIGFTRRAVIDTMIVRNRDDASRAAALLRGGVWLAKGILIDDRMAKNRAASETDRITTPGNTHDDLWNQIGKLSLIDADGGSLRLTIRDAGARLNLNAIVPYTGDDSPVDPDAEEFLTEILTKIIDDLPIDPGEKLYEERELARNLIDYMDFGDIRLSGGSENEYYQGQDPPQIAPNHPLLSVDELGLVEGFDVQLVEALRPYLTVYPLVKANGINLNSAPPHVLSLLYSGVAGQRRLVSEDTVGRILMLREEGRVVCTTSEPAADCATLSEVDLGEGSLFPPSELPDDSDWFTVQIHATAGQIERTLVTVIDRSKLTEPKLLFWRMR